MFKNISVRTRIVASFASILLTLILIGMASFFRLSQLEDQAQLIQSDSLPGLYQSALILEASEEVFSAAQAFVLQNGAPVGRDALADMRSWREKFDRLMVDYERSVTTSDDRQLVADAKGALLTYRNAEQRAIKAVTDKESPAAISAAWTLAQSEHVKFDVAAKALLIQNHNEMNTSLQKQLDSVEIIKISILAGVVIAFGIALAGGYLLFRVITKPLTALLGAMDVVRGGDFTARINSPRADEFGVLAEGFDRMADEVMALVGGVQKSGIQVSTSMNEIAATSKQQQATATEIAATTTEVGATSKEISATSKDLVNTMREVSNVADQAAALASDGQAGLGRMEATMRQVMDAAGSINAKLGILNEKAGNINQVVTTITRVADQTNLLSLNAAIEAEKAGEYGRGFGVVASEIRRLADQTAVATYDIEQMVKEIESAVSAGVMGMDKFSEEVRRGMQEVQQVGGQLGQIIHQVQALAPRFETVNEGMQAQAVGAEQISDALVQLTEAAQQTVESLRQSTLAIDDLNEVSGTLRNTVSRFKLAAA
jgi:methyl-accepting chemotaxis protein WspA